MMHYPGNLTERINVFALLFITVLNEPRLFQDTEKLARTRQNTIKQFFFAEDVPMKEDCLTVNVFTPMRPGSKKDAKLPVRTSLLLVVVF